MIASFEIMVPHAGQGIWLDSVVVVSATAWAGSTFFVVAAVGAAGGGVAARRGAGVGGVGGARDSLLPRSWSFGPRHGQARLSSSWPPSGPQGWLLRPDAARVWTASGSARARFAPPAPGRGGSSRAPGGASAPP